MGKSGISRKKKGGNSKKCKGGDARAVFPGSTDTSAEIPTEKLAARTSQKEKKSIAKKLQY